MNWPEKIKALSISVAGQPTASLLKRSVFQLAYEATAQCCVGLGLPPGSSTASLCVAGRSAAPGGEVKRCLRN